MVVRAVTEGVDFTVRGEEVRQTNDTVLSWLRGVGLS